MIQERQQEEDGILPYLYCINQKENTIHSKYVYYTHRIHIDKLVTECTNIKISGVLHIWLISLRDIKHFDYTKYIDPIYISENTSFFFNGHEYTCRPECMYYQIEFYYNDNIPTIDTSLQTYDCWKYEHSFSDLSVCTESIQHLNIFPFHTYKITFTVRILPYTNIPWDKNIEIVLEPLDPVSCKQSMIRICTNIPVYIHTKNHNHTVHIYQNPLPYICQYIFPLLSLQWSVSFIHTKYTNISIYLLGHLYYNLYKKNIFLSQKKLNYISLHMLNFLLQYSMVYIQRYTLYPCMRLQVLFPLVYSIQITTEYMYYLWKYTYKRKKPRTCLLSYVPFQLAQWKDRNGNLLSYSLYR
jgi:hypothetical protein